MVKPARLLMLSVVLGLLPFANLARASDSEYSPLLAANKKKAKKKAKSEDEDQGSDEHAGGGHTSADVRARNKFGLALTGGDAVGGVSGVGVDVFYEPNSSWQLGVQYLTGKTQLGAVDDADFETTDLSLGINTIMARARFFATNTFSITGGLGERMVTAHFGIQSKTNASDSVESTMNINSLVLALNIGNHWAFDSGFYIGCDWIGYMYPLSSSVSTSTSSSGTLAAGAQDLEDISQKSAEDIGKSGSGQVLMLSLGWLL